MNLCEAIKEVIRVMDVRTEEYASIEEWVYEPDRLLRLAGFHVIDIKWYTEASINPIMAWCGENFSTRTYDHIHGSRWVFEHEQDAVMFTLRWS